MPEPIRRVRTPDSPDLPDFDVYPGSPQQQGVSSPRGRGSIPAQQRPDHLLPEPDGLSRAGERLGRALGTAVRTARELPETVKSRLALVKERSTQSAGSAAGQITERLQDVTGQARKSAQDQLERARARAQYLAREYPLQIIAAAAAGGLLLGIGLRTWRGNRE
jgi:ElaB/YqjD/DUF883 family membrane-anchored ribosome-binding protein